MSVLLDASEAVLVVTSIKTLFSIYLAVTLAIYAIIAVFGFTFGKKPPGSRFGRPVLVITAHPDDECMFFSPAVLGMSTQYAGNYGTIHLLCLSNGDYYGKGKVREKEILKSCQSLGIGVEKVTLINDPHLPDNPAVEWRNETIEAHIRNAVEQIQPEVVCTFDGYGVSGHKNHIAVHQSIKNIFSRSSRSRPQGVRAVYFLESVSLWRKYSGVLDLPFTLLSASYVAVAKPKEVIYGQKAMLAHRSQLEWFRILYILFSRYMVINSFTVETF